MEDHFPVLRVFLLGSFRLELEQPDGTTRVIEDFEALLGRGQSVTLLKLLLIHPERRVKRDVLVRIMWPGCSLVSVRKSLDVTKSTLARTLEELCERPLLPRAIGNPPIYATASQEVLWTDLEACEEAHKQALVTHDPVAALTHWEEVYAFAQCGELLAEDTTAYWYQSPLIQDRRTKLVQVRRQCVSRIADLALECGDTSRALAILTEECATDPANEDLAFHAMNVLVRLGRYPEALARYTQLEAILQERDAEPREETKRLALWLRGAGTTKHWSSWSFEEMGVSGSVRPSLEEHRTDEMGVLLPVESAHAIDWGEAPSPEPFYGRTQELMEFQSWIQVQHCRIGAIFGMGGIGKTSFAVRVIHHVKASFEYVFWRSLQHAPPLRNVLQDAITWLSGQHQTDIPQDTDTLIPLLLRFLQERRCLLILDNCETILQAGMGTGAYRDGYQDYGRLFQRIGETMHQSCLLLTSREKLSEVARIEGRTSSARSLCLTGVGQKEGRELLKEKGLFGSDQAWSTLVQLYSGNPLALKLIAEPIRELFNADISAFLKEESSVVGDILDLIEEQFNRLSEQEQAVTYWLAIQREAVSVEMLWEDSVNFSSKKELLNVLTSLRRRSMIETSGASFFTLQPVIMEYVTDHFICRIKGEIIQEKIQLLSSHSLIKAQTKEYIRETQVRLLLAPLAEHLLGDSGRDVIEHKCKILLQRFHTAPLLKSYFAGNIINLMLHMRYNLHGYDFSHLHIRQAHVQGAFLSGVNFTGADLSTSLFTDTFGCIFSVAFHPHEDLLAAGTASGEVRLWNTINGMPQDIYQGHTDWVRSVAFHPSGQLIASGSEDLTVRLWDMTTRQCIKVLQGHIHRVRSLAFSPNGSTLATGSEDHTVKIWEVSTGQCLQTLQGHTDQVRAVAFGPSGKFILSGSEDQTVRLWELPTGQCLTTFQGHTGPIFAVAVSADGEMIASGGEDHTVRLWDTSTGQCRRMLDEHTKKIRAVAFHPNGRHLASGAEDQTVRLWEINSGHCLKILSGHTSSIFSVAFRSDGNTLASGSEDQTIRLWKVTSGQCLKILRGYADEIRSIAFSPKGDMIASGSEDHTVRIWDVGDVRPLRTLRGHTSRVRAVAFSPNGRLIASGSEDQTVRLWDISIGQCLQTLVGHTNRVRSVAFSPQGDLIASGSEDQTVRLWDISTGQCLAILLGHTNRVRSVAFSPDGNVLASGSEDQTMRLWDVHTMHSLKTFRGHASWIWAISFGPDGKTIASGSEDQSVCLWDREKGTCLFVLQGHRGRVRAVAFSPDGNRVVSGSEDQTIRLWDTGSGSCVKTFHGHASWIWAVAFHPDGKTFASGSHDGTIKIWDVQTGDCLKTIRSERPYEHMNITHATGLTPAQKTMLVALGAFEYEDAF